MRELKLKKLGVFTKWFLSPGFRYIYAGIRRRHFAKTLNASDKGFKCKVREWMYVSGWDGSV
jgi:hypothetical protein